jgi:ABC-2 type transport system permease protein
MSVETIEHVTDATAERSGTEPARGSLDLRAIAILWQREVIRLRRNPLRGAMGLITPLMFLLIFGIGLEAAGGDRVDPLRNYGAYLLPGVLVMAMQAPAIAVGISIVWDRQTGFLRQMLVAPVRRISLLIGLCLGGATVATIYGLSILAVAGLVGVPYGPRLLLVLLEGSLVALAFTALGVLAAVCITRIETFQMVVSLGMMPILFLSGAFFPANGLPGWLGVAVRVNPLTYAIDAIRRTMPGDLYAGGISLSPQIGGWTPPILLELVVVAWSALAMVAVAGYRFSRPG